MPAPYSPDFRKKVLDSYLKNGSLRKTAEKFEVSYGFVQSLTARYRTEETIEPRPHRSGNPPKVRPEHHPFLKKLVGRESGLSLEEICSRFQNKFSVKISVTAMHESLKRLGISRKKNFLRSEKELGYNQVDRVLFRTHTALP
jgi:transposase